jgi:hypothetical protein
MNTIHWISNNDIRFKHFHHNFDLKYNNDKNNGSFNYQISHIETTVLIHFCCLFLVKNDCKLWDACQSLSSIIATLSS